MTWIKRGDDSHNCALPLKSVKDDIDVGDIWKCDQCGQLHQITQIVRDGMLAVKLVWTKL